MSEATGRLMTSSGIVFRPDIEWTLHTDQSRWVARDPLTSKFYYFNQAERAATQLLDGQHTLQQVVLQLQGIFPHLNLSSQWLIMLASRLSAAHLLLPASKEQVARLLKRNRPSKAGALLRLLSAPLSVRIPLFNPAPWLELMRPVAVILFSPVTVWLAVCMAVVASVSVFMRLVHSPNLLSFDSSLLQGDGWLLLLVCYCLVKSLHELGHGLACVYWRARCNELGLLILFFTPCLYCDTTDAWKLRSKWQRAGICAAGMYVEMILASIAAFAWLTTHDGMVHSVAANIVLICSVGTVLVNGNPFLKYDGYYILSDLWAVPNLSDQSREACGLLFKSWMTGSSVAAGQFDRPTIWLATYALISFFYRTFVLLMILWLAWYMLVPLGLGFLTIMIFAGLLLGMALTGWRMIRQLHFQVLAHQSFKFSRLVILMVMIFFVIAFTCYKPLPVVVQSRGVTDFGDKVPLYAPDTCTLVEAAECGVVVEKDTPLLTFDSPEKRLELEGVRDEIKLLEEKIVFLNKTINLDPSTAFELPLSQKMVAERQARARLLEAELGLLQDRAPFRGLMVAASSKLSRPLTAPRDLHLDMTPVTKANHGCTVERGTLLGWFTAQEKLEVIAIVSQQQMKQLRIGMLASCRWDSDVNTITRGHIIRIAPDPIRQTPDELVGDSSLVSGRNASGVFEPQDPHYAVTIAIEKAPPLTPVSRAPSVKPLAAPVKGSLVTVQIHVDSQPLITTLIHAIRLSLKPL